VQRIGRSQIRRDTQTGRFAKDGLGYGKQAHLRAEKCLLIGRLQHGIATFDWSNQRLHQDQIAADNLDRLGLRGLP
jgi:hypothetical protein